MKDKNNIQEHKLVNLVDPKHAVNKFHFFWKRDIHSSSRVWGGLTKTDCLELSQSKENPSPVLGTFADLQDTKNNTVLFYSPPNNPNSFTYLLATKDDQDQKSDNIPDTTYNVVVVDASVEMHIRFTTCVLAVLPAVAAGIFLNPILGVALAAIAIAIGVYEQLTFSSDMGQLQTGIKEELETLNLDNGVKLTLSL